jgi:predicted ATPase
LNPQQTIIDAGVFSIPSKLYGRDADLEYMLQSFDRVKKGNTEIIMIGGYSGVGKSTIVNQFEQIIEEENLKGYVITGKSDKLEKTIPYNPIIQAFEEIVQDILNTTSLVEKLRWKKRLKDAIGRNGKVLIDLIPDIEKIIGKQLETSVTTSKEAINRFNNIFIRFISAVATRNRPLILFLDDLQWIDSASLSLLENITNNNDVKHLMFIGAFRDNEISEHHMLIKTLAAIREKSVEEGKRVVYSMNLHNLTKEDVMEMIAKSLSEKVEDVKGIGNIIYEKTLGNPFFTRQLLRKLYEDNLIRYNTYKYRWEWDKAELAALNITDNVVDLVVNKIKTLPESTHETLKIASCIGRVFDIKTIEAVNQRMNTDTYDTVFDATTKHLRKSQKEGLVILDKGKYKFAHDRIHQAVSSLNSDIFKKKVHLHIGRLSFNNAFKGKFELCDAEKLSLSSEEIFNIINHWNKGIVFIDSKIERSQLATLNLVAGKRAASTAAYEAALSYLDKGISLLYEDSWEKDYSLSLALHSDIMEIEYLMGHLDKLEQRFNYVIKNAKNDIDSTKAYEIRIQSAYAQNDLKLATNLGLEILNKLGVKMPKKANNFHVVLGFVKLWMLMCRKKIDKLILLPDMTDYKAKAVMRIFYAIGASVYLGGNKLLTTYLYRSCQHTLRYGNSEDSVLAYAGYGLLITTRLKQYDRGLEVSKLLKQLIDKYQSNRNRSFVSLISNTFLEHQKNHIGEKVDSLKKAYYSGWQKGEIDFTTLVGFVYAYFSFYSGTQLSELIEEMNEIIKRTEGVNQDLALYRMNIYQQTFINLNQPVENPTRLLGKIFNEDEVVLSDFKDDKKVISYQLLVNKTLLCYLFGEYLNASYYALENEKNQFAAQGSYMERMYCFYSTLSYCKAYEMTDHWKNDSRGKRRLKRRIKKNMKTLKMYSEYGHQNFLHKYKLVQAENYRIQGKLDEAKKAYRASILLAEKEEFINEAALACELAGDFYYKINEIPKAKAHINKSIRAYTDWQAFNKVEHIKKKYTELLAI